MIDDKSTFLSLSLPWNVSQDLHWGCQHLSSIPQVRVGKTAGTCAIWKYTLTVCYIYTHFPNCNTVSPGLQYGRKRFWQFVINMLQAVQLGKSTYIVDSVYIQQINIFFQALKVNHLNLVSQMVANTSVPDTPGINSCVVYNLYTFLVKSTTKRVVGILNKYHSPTVFLW